MTRRAPQPSHRPGATLAAASLATRASVVRTARMAMVFAAQAAIVSRASSTHLSQTLVPPEALDAQHAARHVHDALAHPHPIAGQAQPLVVPDARTAQAIHQAVAGAVYGPDKVQGQSPFHALRSGDFWVVWGTLPQRSLGGTAVTVIRARNGEVVRITHEK